MATLNLKPSHKAVKSYYQTLQNFQKLGAANEGAVKVAFADLLTSCCQQFNWILVQENSLKLTDTKRIQVDGLFVRDDTLKHGIWEAKDTADDLPKEVQKKFAKGYPKDNIIFQSPDRVIIWQGGKQVYDQDITKPEALVESLKLFFEYRPPQIENWEKAAAEFGDKVRGLGEKLVDLIESQRKTNPQFIGAFQGFSNLCRQSINPNISDAAVEEMLIQHLLTERIFRQIFNNPDFTRRNIIAVEIEKVIEALTSKSFSRAHFLGDVDYFYRALEEAAATITEYSEKQHFLNTVYERFFQGFAVNVADTHGIVYTPQSIVDFMVRSVDEILRTEFKKSLSDKGVHILDPFVGTGNFIMRIMREIRKTALSHKYQQELHCNEVMLLPYYIASMNIEHEYLTATGQYQPFDGICLVDTFSVQEALQLDLFTPQNTQRVKQQQSSPIFVVIGNPPYNAWQQNENDNNKNRKYSQRGGVDQRVAETYAKDSKATLKNSLYDPYVKAFRWAADRIEDEGIVAFVSNNSFIDAIAFDGMRQHLAQDFDAIYILDLGGNIRKNASNQPIYNVFDIKVGVSINLLIKKKEGNKSPGKIYYAAVGEFWRKQEKYDYLEKCQHLGGVDWEEIKPDKKHTWLTAGLQADFETFIPMGSKKTKAAKGDATGAIFKIYSRGAETARDDWAYNFNPDELAANIQRMIATYNEQTRKWHDCQDPSVNLDDFVISDDTKIKWSSRLKECLKANITTQFIPENVRNSLYRPFCFQFLYFDEVLTHRRGQFPYIFPTPETEKENRVICIVNEAQIPFSSQITNYIPCLHYGGRQTQCFPFYTYDEDGNNRQENITDWALDAFREEYENPAISKWDIFYYIYGLLHHPRYREKYADNLKREIARIPYAPDFESFAKAGKRLAEIHLNYEKQPEYPLEFIENDEVALNWRVEKMKLSKDKTQLIYNEFLTLAGIPREVFAYRLGNRSALDWIIDRYQVKIDKRSGIENDPNRLDDEQYIVRLIGQVITVSLETVDIVNQLPSLE
ncbi:MAG: N-6 DNA methylase [Limnospira sp. PMC 1291.21]|uniref:type ISP restriction/modification enzyme n=2 Tax=unclassified Limnospira TaxID=2642885 RepID=UPI0028E0BB60|nr:MULTISPECIES: type ISP restriction/modification enzyme [unclassified Limnospira]MDT9179309.1 N-6 DNA methylase [Limnospira sp. PMC 1238.20]MDT9194576.1 N-6 DNA methylase [Limnospira sp. PMC 1245.20]MDT9202280.1 N-6 DNA methylase [Limnospira sp. PMC 1243.20]MDT9209967.1 N-6 DNA methylase [Limnospira sp. PMC 1252.20]MDT9215106.1 N-6 DNA methylase [Limnospira sp. PMC 1256.20]